MQDSLIHSHNLAPALLAAQADPLMDLMRQYVQAKREFDAACERFNSAGQARTKAEQVLLQLSEKVQKIVATGAADPTAPQPSPQGNSFTSQFPISGNY